MCPAALQGQAGPHGIWADGRKLAEPLACLTCFYSGVGRSTHPASHQSHQGKSHLLYILSVHKAYKGPILTFQLYNRASFYACGPLLKATQALPSHSCLDIQVREPGSIFPASHPVRVPHCTVQMRDAFYQDPLLRRAEPCIHMPRQQYSLQQQVTRRQALPPKIARTHRHSVGKEAHHFCRGSPVRHSIAWASEANAHRAWLTL